MANIVTLYDAAWAPSPRRVRIFLAEKGITVPMERIDLRAGEQYDAAFRAINPRCAVPALVFDDGRVLDESAAICRYFEAVQPDPPLFGNSPEEIGTIEAWTRRIESEGYVAVAYVFRNALPGFRDRAVVGDFGPVPQIPDLIERGRTMWRGFLAAFDHVLGEREWVAGDRFSFADVTALVTVDFARGARLDVPENLANLARWHAAASARPSAAA